MTKKKRGGKRGGESDDDSAPKAADMDAEPLSKKELKKLKAAKRKAAKERKKAAQAASSAAFDAELEDAASTTPMKKLSKKQQRRMQAQQEHQAKAAARNEAASDDDQEGDDGKGAEPGNATQAPVKLSKKELKKLKAEKRKAAKERKKAAQAASAAAFDAELEDAAASPAVPMKKLSKKQQRRQKAMQEHEAREREAAEADAADDESASDDDAEEEGDSGDDAMPVEPKKLNKKELKKLKADKRKAAKERKKAAQAATAAAFDAELEDAAEESDDGGSAPPPKALNKKELKKLKAEKRKAAKAKKKAAQAEASAAFDADLDDAAAAPKPTKKLTKKQQRRLDMKLERDAAAKAATQDQDEEEGGDDAKSVDTRSMSKKELKKFKAAKRKAAKEKKRAAANVRKDDSDDDATVDDTAKPPAPPAESRGGGGFGALMDDSDDDSEDERRVEAERQAKAERMAKEKAEEAERKAREAAEAVRIAKEEAEEAERIIKARVEAEKAAVIAQAAKEKEDARIAEERRKEEAELAAMVSAMSQASVQPRKTRSRKVLTLKQQKAQYKAAKHAYRDNKKDKGLKAAYRAAKAALEAMEKEQGPSKEAEEEEEEQEEEADKGVKEPKKKKLSNKERRRLANELKANERQIELDRANGIKTKSDPTKHDSDQEDEDELTGGGVSASTRNFSVTQSSLDESNVAWQESKDIVVRGFSINTTGKKLLYSADLLINHGQKYGLLGPNGHGKTTLLKMIACGELKIPPSIDFLMVEQECQADDTLAVEAVLLADKERSQLLAAETRLMKQLDSDDLDPIADEDKLMDLQDELEATIDALNASKADAAEGRARSILAGLGFTAEMQERKTKHFSGGWRMRISLAKALYMRPTLLMLDEPTNHLDLNAVLWLDDYLSSKWKGTLLIVSHDQDFLSNVCDNIIHLEALRLNYYKGDYDTFKKMHAQKMKKMLKDYEQQQKAIRNVKRKGKSGKKAEKDAKDKHRRQKVKGGGRKGKKGQTGLRGTGEEEVVGESVETGLLERPKEYTVEFDFTSVGDLRPPVIEVMGVSFGYNKGCPLFNDVSFGITLQSRITIVGPNGVGKSTMIKLLLGELEPTDGTIRRNHRLRVGKYNQHFSDILPMKKSATQYLLDAYCKEDNFSYQEARNLLGKVGLQGHAHTIPIQSCSGGQKARIVFAGLIMQQPHIIYLDEPTNHLDIESIDALADAMRGFNGGIVLVSHDARLIKEAECDLWVCGGKTLTPFDGDIDDYRDELLADILRQEEEMKSVALKKEDAAREQREQSLNKHRKRTNREKRELRKVLDVGPAKKASGDAVALANAERELAEKLERLKLEGEKPVVKVDAGKLASVFGRKKKKKKKKTSQ